MVAATGLLSPVRMERSNLRSLETLKSRISAGTLEPSVILTMSPATSSAAGNLKRSLRSRRYINARHYLLEGITVTNDKDIGRKHTRDRSHHATS